MASTEKDTFYFESETEDGEPGIVRFNLSAIRNKHSALDRGKWFVQLEYIYFHLKADKRVFIGHLVSPEVLDSSEREKALLGIIEKKKAIGAYFFSPGDPNSRRIVHPMNYTKDSLTLELLSSHGSATWDDGEIAKVYFTAGISIHIPRGPRHR
jgi:hypothetical protein